MTQETKRKRKHKQKKRERGQQQKLPTESSEEAAALERKVDGSKEDNGILLSRREGEVSTAERDSTYVSEARKDGSPDPARAEKAGNLRFLFKGAGLLCAAFESIPQVASLLKFTLVDIVTKEKAGCSA